VRGKVRAIVRVRVDGMGRDGTGRNLRVDACLEITVGGPAGDVSGDKISKLFHD
jgi:hypothetical protein